MKFTEMLRARWRNADTLLCVGLDPDLARLPEELAGKPDAIYSFCTGIVDATADLVCAFKPQIAYFASEGAEDALNRVVAYIHSNHPGILSSLMPSAAILVRRPSTTPKKLLIAMVPIV